MGAEDVEEVATLFQVLKKRGFPVPTTAYISPLLRTIQTSKGGLSGLEITRDKKHVVKELREQLTGNSADILIGEYVRGEKKPPPANSGLTNNWMEEGKDEKGNDLELKLKRRVRRLLKELPGQDDSDCIVRVTHSLLNRYTLMDLAMKDSEKSTLKRFMLREAGLFAYVAEVDKHTGELIKTTRLDKYEDAKIWRRGTAFSDPDHLNEPEAVRIEPGILKRRDIIEEENAQSNLSIDSRDTVRDKRMVGGSKQNIIKKGSNDFGENIDKNRDVNLQRGFEGRARAGRVNVGDTRNKAANCRGDVGSKGGKSGHHLQALAVRSYEPGTNR
jgi:broad specificity phosphatase PhoE